MPYQYIGQCVFPGAAAETELSQFCGTAFNFNPAPPWATNVSWWIITSRTTGSTSLILYNQSTTPWTHIQTLIPSQTWVRGDNPVTPGTKYGWTVKEGDGTGCEISASWYSGPYDPNQDPANPNAGTIARCAYGTQPQPSASVTAVVTPALVDLVLTALGLEELAFLFDVIWYSTLNVSEMCSSLPPVAPPIDLNLLTASPSTLQSLFTALAWPHFCQCSPGTPAPIAPVSPQGPTTTPWPTQPTFPCADTDVCAALVAMQRQLQALQSTLASVWDVTSSVQRYRVPFGYVGGTQHTSLTGEGSITVSRLVGLQVVVSELPQNNRVLASNPDYLWNVGWISVSDGGGMLQQRRIARQSMTWFPEQMQEATTVGYFLESGVTASLVELKPEP